MNADDIASSVWIILTSTNLHVIKTNDNQKKWFFDLQSHEFDGDDHDPMLIRVRKPALSYKVRFIHMENKGFIALYCDGNSTFEAIRKK